MAWLTLKKLIMTTFVTLTKRRVNMGINLTCPGCSKQSTIGEVNSATKEAFTECITLFEEAEIYYYYFTCPHCRRLSEKCSWLEKTGHALV
jgi:Zn ribbon nucleic-acid-binding protein